MIRIFVCLFLIIYMLTSAGCSYEVFHRKFVRKKKKQAGALPVCSAQPFTKPLNAEIYGRAFLFWKTQQEQLLTALSPQTYPYHVNNLKVENCLEEALSNLDTMKVCLNPNKQKELDIYIKQLAQYKTLFKKQVLSWAYTVRMRQDLEMVKRNVAIRFCPGAVKNELAPEPEPVKTENTDNPKK